VKPIVFVDGQEGTTGLRIHEHLAMRNDLEILKIAPDKRRDLAEREKLLNAADVVFLCLPDGASREAVGLVTNPRTIIIDASTAFRTDPAWTFGLPELHPTYRTKLKTSKRIAVPGCHATAFLLPVAPLVSCGVIAPSAPLTCFSLTGYSGGGKKMIAEYESPAAPASFKGPRPYALTLAHKHLPEMKTHSGLNQPPLFQPVVCNVHSGLTVETFLPAPLLSGSVTPQEIHALLSTHYQDEPFIRILPFDPDATGTQLTNGFFDITANNGTNRADIAVFGNSRSAGNVLLLARLDNLGKGASTAAIQCMNLALNLDETIGLAS